MTGLRPRVIVTRPAREAARWVEALTARGIDAVALPLIAIAPMPPGAAALPRELHAYAALMFVSPAAVDCFYEQIMAAAPVDRALSAIEIIAIPRYWAPGPGTASALQRAGVPASRIDLPAPDAPQFDSEALWAQVHAQVRPGARVLLVRGADAHGQPAGRDWLARAIEAAGGAVDTLVTYRRMAAALDAPARESARRAAHGLPGLWLFGSSEAVAHLCAALPDVDWRAAHALATHPRIADAARAAGFGVVTTVSPRLDAVVASIESIR